MRIFFKVLWRVLWEIRSVIALIIFINVLFWLLSEFFKIPIEVEDFINLVRGFYRDYGYSAVIIAGLIEGIAFLNWYFPGSSAIILGAVFAGEGLLSLPLLIILGTVSLSIGSLINYFAGKYGWYKILEKLGFSKHLQNVQQKITGKGLLAILPWYFHPQFAAFVSIAAGVLKYNFPKFFVFNALAFLLFGSFWGILAFYFGPVILKILSGFFWPIIAASLLIWISFKIYLNMKLFHLNNKTLIF